MRWSSSVPSSVRSGLLLRDGERVLAGAADTAGTWHVGSQSALHVGTADGHKRIPWESIDRAMWDKGAGTLTVVEIADFGQPEPKHVLALEEPGRLLELVRERITASVLLTRRVGVTDAPDKSVTVIARRSPERTGDVTFAYLIDPGLDPDSQEARAAGAKGLAALRTDLGF